MVDGGPRIDSTCFFDMPATTSSTFALVIVFEELQAEIANVTTTAKASARECPPKFLRKSIITSSNHLSHSPITKSRLPRTATTSLIEQPGKSSGRILRFTNDGARIFKRCGTPPPLLLM